MLSPGRRLCFAGHLLTCCQDSQCINSTLNSPTKFSLAPCLGAPSCPELPHKRSWLIGCFPVCALDLRTGSPCLPSRIWPYLLLLLSALPGSSSSMSEPLMEPVSHPWPCLPQGTPLGSPQLITSHHQFFLPECVSDFNSRSLGFAHLYSNFMLNYHFIVSVEGLTS